jgi:hypothetical protein
MCEKNSLNLDCPRGQIYLLKTLFCCWMKRDKQLTIVRKFVIHYRMKHDESSWDVNLLPFITQFPVLNVGHTKLTVILFILCITITSLWDKTQFWPIDIFFSWFFGGWMLIFTSCKILSFRKVKLGLMKIEVKLYGFFILGIFILPWG